MTDGSAPAAETNTATTCTHAATTCDEDLRLAAAGEEGRRALHLAHSHLGAHQVGHCGTTGGRGVNTQCENALKLSVEAGGSADSLGEIRLKISGSEQEKTSRMKGWPDVPSTAWIQRYVQNFSGPEEVKTVTQLQLDFKKSKHFEHYSSF